MPRCLKLLHRRQNPRKSSLILALIAFLLTLSAIVTLKHAFRNNKTKCFILPDGLNTDLLLTDIMEDNKTPTYSQTIFFHETSCSQDQIIKLNSRQACAIESAAKMNPKWDVFVLFASPVGFLNKTSLPLIDALKSYDNIHFRNVNLWNYAVGTPIADWIRDGQIFYSSYMNSHVSDFLRYLSLYKWGGTYLDLDVIVKVNFDTVPSNYAGAESEDFVAAGIINLDYDGFGHEIAEMCLSDFQLNFNGDDWGNNGPGVITRVLRKVCQTDRPLFMTRDRCRGFKVFPINAFYAIGWKDWRHFFSEKKTKEVLELVNNKSIVVHFWNKHSSKERIRVGSTSAYGQLADEYCPRVYRSSGDFF
ncbi:lactosylceramide 4-alpha-galactosyltransferase-like [Phlebotomus argentipes]|uniref:lactosylceramide 4-alpha-galactosyltransferase-like n=1 Tax=Phlebotomus argentipes TaxID=94469 RepID=UPI002892FA94|nr:lactosylceramide 4-alpha-galactosyltransferase-like [Phlebotomus argentipes]